MRPNPLSNRQPIDILLVEDSPMDVRLAERGCRQMRLPNRLHVVQDGVEAIAFLLREGDYAAAPRPDLILLDLNLPKKSGCEVLRAIKSRPNLRAIPTIVLTSSDREEDVLGSYRLHANCFITKPATAEELTRVMAAIERFWLTLAQLPSGRPFPSSACESAID